MKNELAIICPVLNCLEFTREMISTIYTKYPYKLLLIDNGSTDGTREFFTKLKEVENIDVTLFKENIGVGPAWNYGIQRAIRKYDSRYFFIPNNDILLHPDTIDTLLETVKDENIALATATDISGKVNTALDVLSLPMPSHEELTEAPEFSCFMLKKETIEKIGYFDEKFFPAYFEDNDYHYRIRLAGLNASKTNRAIYFHYGSRTIKDNGQIRDTANYGYTINREYYKEKWGGIPGEEKYKIPFNKK
jgi:GT2 family glycosyltransferase